MRTRIKRGLRKLTFREPCPRKLRAAQLVAFHAVTSIAAIAPPSTYLRASAPSGTAKLRQMLASDAIAVRPVQPIPDEKQRLPKRNVDSTTDASAEAPEYDVRRSRGPDSEEVRSRPIGQRPSTGETRTDGGFRPDEPPPSARPPSPSAAASPSTGFVTQSIAQEAIGNGLHIEPWRTAISAYRRAGSGPQESLVSNISV